MITIPESAYTQLVDGLQICRILNGMWQVSGAHGTIDPVKALKAMLRYHDAGFTTWDLADHYGPAEDFIGAFRKQIAKSRGDDELQAIKAFTKWVPRAGSMQFTTVEKAINVSLKRMNVECLDLLQFHWWEYEDPAYLEALDHLATLQERGKIKHLALTNFDTSHVETILDHGIPVISNQVQYSIIDQRPAILMAPAGEKRDFKLLAYGTLCGGLLSERYLGKPEPGWRELDTASLQKYKRMIDAWGGWLLFQDLLGCLDDIARKHEVRIANVATRFILDQPSVAGVIVGARLGIADHFDDNASTFSLTLDADDLASIQEIMGNSKDLFRLIGDCGDEYRR